MILCAGGLRKGAQPLFSGQSKGNGILKTSAPERIRTTNLLIRSQMLYPVELRAPERGS